MKNFRYLQQKYLVNTYPDRGLSFVRGDGVFLFDKENRRYLDMMTNYGVSIFGYNHPRVTGTLCDQLGQLVTLHCSFNSEPRALAAQSLIQRCSGSLSKVHFSSSGAEAIEAALKFAIVATGKKKFITTRNGYHGKTLGALSASGQMKYRKAFEPLLYSFCQVDFGSIEQVKDAVNEETAAMIIEPIQGEGGVFLPEPGYLRQIHKTCRETGVLLIVDEIQTGLGRTGSFLASSHEVDSYDILCLGKGLAGGIPAGATLVSSRVASKIPLSIHTSTFGGNPLASAGILTVLNLLDEGMMAHIRRIGDYFLKQLKRIESHFIREVRGRGVMLGVEVNDQRNAILKGLQERNVLAIPADEKVVRFLPSYIIDKSHVDQAVDVLDQVLKILKDRG